MMKMVSAFTIIITVYFSNSFSYTKGVDSQAW